MLPGRHVESPGLLHRHRGVSTAWRVPLSLRLSVVIYGTAWQALDLGEWLICSGEGWRLAGHRCGQRCPSWLCSRDHCLDRSGPSGPLHSSRETLCSAYGESRAGRQKLLAVDFGQPVPWGSSPGAGLGSSPSSPAGGFGFHRVRWWRSGRLGAQSGVPERIVH